MKERPILFSTPMVRALLDGSKTQTRRVVKPQPPAGTNSVIRPFADHRRQWAADDPHDIEQGRLLLGDVPACPCGQPGDRLWVRETWGAFRREDGRVHALVKGDVSGWPIEYRADGSDMPRGAWRSSIHMPQAMSRILLEITDVRVERLQDISEADAMAEGIVRQYDDGFGLADTTHYHSADPRMSYLSLWEAINGRESVERNDWVWAVSFRRVPSLAPGEQGRQT